MNVIMDRNGSFVSGYLWEILSSAKEPREDLYATQDSSETGPKDLFFFSTEGTALCGGGLVNCQGSRQVPISSEQQPQADQVYF